MSLKDLIKKAEVADKADKSKGKLFLSILGPSGSGKSHSIGTLEAKTLYLYFSGEKHGVSAARKVNSKNIVPICVDVDEDSGDLLSADDTLAKIRSIVRSDVSEVGFEAIALDGLTELDDCINNSNELKKQCLTNVGKVDGFRISGVAKKMASGLIKDLVHLQQKTGVHVLVTAILDVKDYEDNGRINECLPRLTTYSLAEGLLQQFGDRVIVCPVTKDSGEKVYIYDFMSDITRASKDEKGKIKKAFNFSPRLSTGSIPDKGFIKADLKELLKCKGK